MSILPKRSTIYRTIIKAGTHKAPSIMVAEASKAIENAQEIEYFLRQRISLNIR